jgi:hypothetical protein
VQASTITPTPPESSSHKLADPLASQSHPTPALSTCNERRDAEPTEKRQRHHAEPPINIEWLSSRMILGRPLNVTPVTSRVLARVSKTEPFTVRTLDAIHPEAAIRLRARGNIDTVLTIDKQFRAGREHHAIPLAALPEVNQAEDT